MPLSPLLLGDRTRRFGTHLFRASIVLASALHPLHAKASSMDLDLAVESAIQGKSYDLAAIQPATDSVTFARALAIKFSSEAQVSRRAQITMLLNGFLSWQHPCQDRETIARLLEGATRFNDQGSEAAIGVLESRCAPKALASMGQAILGPLQSRPSKAWIDLARHAKAPGSLEVLKNLAAKSPEWTYESAWKEAMAANGDNKLESAYVDTFLKSEDPLRKKELIGALGRIQTRKSLAALAQELRTPLVYQLGRVFQESLREQIALELWYAFPERIEYPTNTDESYAKIEAFCQKEFGTKWKTKRPPPEYSGPLEHGYSPIPPGME